MPDWARYSRQVILPGFGPEAQERLQGSRVFISGLGGLGSPVALYLAAAGVGKLGLADFDQVEKHNLHRQILHRDETIGWPKTASAMDQLDALNPTIDYDSYLEGLTPQNALEILSDYDLLIDGADNFGARYLANDAAYLAGIPVVHGSVLQFEGQVTVFDPHQDGPCYRCLFPQMPEPGSVPNCAEAGVLGALCGIVGSAQALEAIKLLTGLGEPLRGRLAVFDALTFQWRQLKLKRDPHCPLCGEEATIESLDPDAYPFACLAEAEPPQPQSSGPATSSQAESAHPENLDTMTNPFATGQDDLPLEISVEVTHPLVEQGEVLLLDVREVFEREIAAIEPSLFIPLGELAQRTTELPTDKPLIVYCHHGRRSLSAAQFLRAKGYPTATSMKGGIDLWSRQIDPSLERY